MKRVILIISLVLIGMGTTQAQDVFKKYGHKKEMLTLSKGKYQEVFKNEEVVQIGTVLLNTKTNKVVKLLQEDTTKINYNAELSSRFLTVDPMAEEYYSYSPYAYAMNNPVYYVDPTGEFSTKFGAWLYKVFNGGGDILQDKGGEYFVSQQVEYTGEGVGAAVSRKFDWSGRSTGKDLAFEAKLDAFKTDMEFQQLCEQHGMEYVRYDNRSDAIAGMLQPASAVVLPNPIVRSANTAINSIKTVRNIKWKFGNFKTPTKWAGQMAKRGWNESQISEAVSMGKSYKAINNVNKMNGATRYVHPTTGKSVVLDDVTNELLQVGGEGFKW